MKINTRKGVSLIEIVIAISIFSVIVLSVLLTTTFLRTNSIKAHLELLAENLSDYLLEDLRGRRFYILGNSNDTPINNLYLLYEHLPYSEYVPNPFINEANVVMKYDINVPITANNPYFDFNFSVENKIVNIEKYYKNFKFDIYITRYPIDINNINDIYKTIYKADIVIKWKEGKNSRMFKNSTEISYHEP